MRGARRRHERRQIVLHMPARAQEERHHPDRAHALESLAPAASETAAGPPALGQMERSDRLKRLRFRAWHRGVREADLLVGSFFDRHHRGWNDADLAWFERLMEEQDVDILAWAMGQAEPPAEYRGPLMEDLKNINYIKHQE